MYFPNKLIIKEAEKQHYNRLTAISSNEIETAWNMTRKGTAKLHSTEQVPTTLTDSQNMKGSINMASAFNNFFLRTTKELNICIHQVEMEDAVSFFISLELP